ncbi:hypothetical protein GCM10025792_24250 [Pseudonocardia tropica]
MMGRHRVSRPANAVADHYRLAAGLALTAYDDRLALATPLPAGAAAPVSVQSGCGTRSDTTQPSYRHE